MFCLAQRWARTMAIVGVSRPSATCFSRQSAPERKPSCLPCVALFQFPVPPLLRLQFRLEETGARREDQCYLVTQTRRGEAMTDACATCPIAI